MAGGPALFRIILQVSDLDQAEQFYGSLLSDSGRRIPYASRHYIDCGSVILALVDPAIDGETAKPLPDYIYFAVDNIAEIHARAMALNCLATDNVHGEASGEVVKRPWGELSFYAYDPWGNGLCFVDKTTLFTGR